MSDVMEIFKKSQNHILTVQDAVQKEARKLDEKVGMDFGEYLDSLAEQFGFKESK